MYTSKGLGKVSTTRLHAYNPLHVELRVTVLHVQCFHGAAKAVPTRLHARDPTPVPLQSTKAGEVWVGAAPWGTAAAQPAWHSPRAKEAGKPCQAELLRQAAGPGQHPASPAPLPGSAPSAACMAGSEPGSCSWPGRLGQAEQPVARHDTVPIAPLLLRVQAAQSGV